MFLRIKDLEIDNQLTILDRYLIVLKQIDKNSKFIQFNLEIEENIIDKTFEINEISFKIEQFILKLESTLLIYIFKFTNNITLDLQTSITKVHPIFLSFIYSKNNKIKLCRIIMAKKYKSFRRISNIYS